MVVVQETPVNDAYRDGKWLYYDEMGLYSRLYSGVLELPRELERLAVGASSQVPHPSPDTGAGEESYY